MHGQGGGLSACGNAKAIPRLAAGLVQRAPFAALFSQRTTLDRMQPDQVSVSTKPRRVPRSSRAASNALRDLVRARTAVLS